MSCRINCSLSTWLLVVPLAPVSLAILVTLCVALAPLNQGLATWSAQIGAFQQGSINATTMIKASNIAASITHDFTKVKTELSMAASYISHALSAPLVMPVAPGHEIRSFYGTSAVDPRIPPTGVGTSGVLSDVVQLFSTVYKAGTSSFAQFQSLQYLNVTALIDMVLPSIRRRTSNLYTDLYVGMHTGLFRTFPSARLDDFDTFDSGAANTAFGCAGGIGYDPRCRTWYQMAVVRNSTIFTEPYKDALSGDVLVSAAEPMWSLAAPGVLLGVMAFDFSMTSLSQTVLGIQILTHGYAFLMDSDRTVIVHKSLERSATDDTSVLIEDLEPTLTVSASINAKSVQWDDLISRAKRQPGVLFWPHAERKVAVIRPGGQTAADALASCTECGTTYLYAVYLAAADYVLVIVVPESDIFARPNEVQASLKGDIDSAIDIVVGITVCLYVVVLCTTFALSRYFTRPLKNHERFLKRAAALDPDLESGDMMAPAMNAEEQSMNQDLLDLSRSFKMGNDHLYDNNPAGAILFYGNSLAMFKRSDENRNPRGEGACYNNMALVYQQLGDLQKAQVNSRLAVQTAEDMLRNVKNDKERRAVRRMLGNRKMNMAVLYAALDNPDVLPSVLLEQALALHTEVDSKFDNLNGVIQVRNNMNALLLREGRLDEAERGIRDMVADIKKREVKAEQGAGIAIFMQLKSYAFLNFGRLETERHHYETAALCFLHLLSSYERLQPGIQDTCLLYLNRIIAEMSRAADAGAARGGDAAGDAAAESYRKVCSWISAQVRHDLDARQVKDAGRVAGTVSPSVRWFYFVQDTSGSMENEGRMMQCKVSLRHIVEKVMTARDQVSMDTFSDIVRPWAIQKMPKQGNTDRIVRYINGLPAPVGGTAFYDALGQAMDRISGRAPDAKAAGGAFAAAESQVDFKVAGAAARGDAKRVDGRAEDKWLIALTDGDDMDSKEDKTGAVAVSKAARLDANLIIITAGLDEKSKSLGVIQRIVAAHEAGHRGSSVHNKSLHIPANGDSIRAAFTRVVEFLGQVNIEQVSG